MKNCKKGKSCSATCIAQVKDCRVELSGQLSENLSKVAKTIQQANPYSDWKPIAEGNYGKVSMSPDGERAVKELLEHKGVKGEFGPHEVDLATKMGELGHSPKVFSHSKDHIEMERAMGRPLWKGYSRAEDEPSMNAEQATKAAAAIRDLHKMGFSHHDMHSQQFLVNGNNVKLVDFGLSKPAKDEPRAVVQDLNKISKLVDWDNPKLDNDPYVELVRRTRKKYAEANKKKQEEEKIAIQYLRELETY